MYGIKSDVQRLIQERITNVSRWTKDIILHATNICHSDLHLTSND